MPTITSPITIAAGQTETYAAGPAYTFQEISAATPPSLMLNGTIAVDAGSGGGVAEGFLATGGPFHATITIGASGTLKVYSTAATGSALGLGTAVTPNIEYAPNLTNQGLIDIKGTVSAAGVSTRADITVNNSGAIHVLANGIFGVPGGPAVGIELSNGGTIINSGLIDVIGGPKAVGVETGGPAGTFVNTGTIQAAALGPADPFGNIQAYGVAWFGSGSFTNSGTIKATVAVESNAATTLNSGQIIGDVRMGGFSAAFTNSGTVSGDISLTSGADTYSGGTGILHGAVHGGAGQDLIVGGAGPEDLFGEDGNDMETTAANYAVALSVANNAIGFGGYNFVAVAVGADVVVFADSAVDNGGADDAVVLQGRSLADISADTCDGGAGADQVRGGQGDDSLSGGASADYISGDRGNDTETGGAGADLFHTFSGAGVDRALDFHISEGDRVMLDPGTVFSVSQLGADTVIDMGNGDQLILVGVQMSTLTPGWIFGA